MQRILIVRAQFQGLLIGLDRTRVITLFESGIAKIVEGVRLDFLAFNAGKCLTGILVAPGTIEGDAAAVIIGELARRSRVVAFIEFSGGILLRGFEQGSAGSSRKYQQCQQKPRAGTTQPCIRDSSFGDLDCSFARSPVTWKRPSELRQQQQHRQTGQQVEAFIPDTSAFVFI